MKKKLLSILMTTVIICTLTACNSTQSSTQSSTQQSSATSTSAVSNTSDATTTSSIISDVSELQEDISNTISSATSTSSAAETTTSSVSEATSESVSPTTEHWEGDLSAGNYIAGKDIPCGTYSLTATSGSGNVSSSNMYTGGLNEIMGSDTSDGYTINTFNGLQMTDGVILSIGSTAVIHLSSDDAQTSNVTPRAVGAEVQTDLSAGNYTAGTDFPAGVYNIIATGSSGNVSSTNLYDGGVNEIMGTDTSDGMTISQFNNVELPEGTTLTVSGTSIQLVPVGE